MKQQLKRFCHWIRCLSVRDCFLLVVVCTLIMSYLSFRFSGTLRQTSVKGGWQHSLSMSKALKRSILAQHGNQEKWNSAKPVQAYNFSSKLDELLIEIEDQWLQSHKVQERIALVTGQPGVISRDMILYEKTLKFNGFNLVRNEVVKKELNSSFGHFGRKNSLDMPQEAEDESQLRKQGKWLLLLCLTFSDSSCLEKIEMKDLKPYQKVNRFPGLRNVLWKRDAFCLTMTMAKQIPEMRNHQVSPLCFVLPSQFSQFVHVADALGFAARWTVKPISPSNKGVFDSGSQVLDPNTETGINDIQRIATQRVVVQQLVDNPLTVFDQPVSIRVYVLVTSLAPLRAYIHSEGLVHHRYGLKRNFRKIAGRTWLLSELWNYVAKNYGMQSVKSALSNLYHVLLQMLLIVEAAILTTSVNGIAHRNDICRHCYQLLGVDAIFNTSFHPVILEVNGQPTLRESPRSTKINRLKRTLVDDMIHLLFPKEPISVAQEVANALRESSTDIGILDWSCPISSELCLSRKDLQFLLNSRRESVNQGGFRQLYPSSEAGRHGDLLEQLQRHFTDRQAAGLWMNYRRHTTNDLHRLLVNVERWYSRVISEEYDSDIDVPSGNTWKTANSSDINNNLRFEDLAMKSMTEIGGGYNKKRFCSDDPGTMPFLASIWTHPQLTLTPGFNPLVTEYYVNVTYDTMLIRLSAISQNCQTEARVEDRFGSSRMTNYTLGLGENRISFMVVDISHTEPWVINSYSLTVHRLPVTHEEEPFEPSQEHQICSLKQECEMQIFSSEPCGLQRDRLKDVTWSHYLMEYRKLPLCNRGDAQGRWILPCERCVNRSSCFWNQATWHPYACRYGTLTPKTLEQCFEKKKLMFIGDSTNRGMMHYLIERLNGTLTEWDKTHDIRIYNNINGGKTSVSFAYYPQFWLPTNQRPVFDKALYQLIQRSRPLENSTNSILVVGGVHWLATQHLHMLLRAIRVERLHGIKLVMKTLGAGFHQPVDSVHTLSMTEQQKLVLHSSGLAEFARHYNFEVIDTFNITVSRYKDFMQGKCACHFHRVVEQRSPEKSIPRWKHKDFPTQQKSSFFHVEGPINAIYSEILISRLCGEYAR